MYVTVAIKYNGNVSIQGAFTQNATLTAAKNNAGPRNHGRNSNESEPQL